MLLVGCGLATIPSPQRRRVYWETSQKFKNTGKNVLKGRGNNQGCHLVSIHYGPSTALRAVSRRHEEA